MRKKLIIVLFISLLSGYIHAQDKESYCYLILDSANNALKRNSLPEALERLKYLEICDYQNTLREERLKLQNDIFDSIQNQKNKLDILYKKVNIQNRELDDKNKELIAQRDAIDSLYLAAIYQAYKNAPSEYARLIREGPSDKKNIQKEFFDLKLAAYTAHLDTLEHLIAGTKDADAIRKYKNLINRLYYNNDLYEKIYTCFENTTDSIKILFKNDASKQSYKFFSDFKTNNEAFRRNQGSLPGNIKAFKEDKDDQKTICSTEDNYILVYSSTGNSHNLEKRIPMGARVNALDYDAKNNIIYFGMETGNIGFIKYDEDKKNQPVFANSLGTPAVAVQFFETYIKDSLKYFLLAAGKQSKVVLYELNENSPVSEEALFSNTLPEKYLGELINAQFDKNSMRIIIKGKPLNTTSETFYTWNPFTKLALDEYKRIKVEFTTKLEETKIYPTKENFNETKPLPIIK